jgi:hypothetical protein
MGKCISVVLLMTCVISLAGAQTPSSAPPADQTGVTAQTSVPATASADASAATTTTTDAPWDKFKNFSALMTGAPVPGGDDEVHIYRSGDKLRMEGPGKSYIIQDLSKDKDTRAISKLQCLQMSGPFTRSYPIFMSGKDYKYEHLALGKDTIDGHPTQIEEVTVIFPPAKKHPPLKLKLWEAEDLQGFPIKVQTPHHRIIEYRKVDFGPIDPTLFIAPNDCGPLDKTDAKSSAKPKKAPAKKTQ